VIELKNDLEELCIWQLHLFVLKSPLTKEKYQNMTDNVPCSVYQ